MEDITLAIYERPSAYTGRKHYHRANKYHEYCKLVCTRCDNSKEREMGIQVNGKEVPDYFDIVVYNSQDEAHYRHHFTDRDSANNCLRSILIKYDDFVRTF